VVDYTVHYVKKSGGTSAKVFKLREFTLEGNAAITLTRSQSVRNMTTRVHYSGQHAVEIVVNGQTVARDSFVLTA
jgi:hypothetical protein